MQSLSVLFPLLSQEQLDKLQKLKGFYEEWNQKINVISRKDIEHFDERHLIHALSLLLFVEFEPNTTVMDLGTGGGFPGLPLAITNPNTQFLLVDSIKKKLTVVDEICKALNITNVQTHWGRAEELTQKYDVVVCRAVAQLSKLIMWSKFNYKTAEKTMYALKGGDLKEEIKEAQKTFGIKKVKEHSLYHKIKSPFFETKKLVVLKW